MLKRFAFVIIAALLCAGLAACSSSSSSSKGESSSPESSSSQARQESKYYDVSITGAEVVQDGVLLVTFDYTNKTNTAVNFIQAITTTVFQDGVQAMQSSDYVGPTGSDGITPDFMVKVEPGATATVHMAFSLNGTGDVKVQCVPGFVDGSYPMDEGVIAQASFEI